MSYEPKIVGFLCNWCAYTGADLAGTARMKYPANIRIIRVMCSGRIDPTFVLKAFKEGADGVLMAGCHPPSDCHYQNGNYKAMRRYPLLKKMISQLGIEEERLRLEWISAAEGEKLVTVVNEMVDKLSELGPLGISNNGRGGTSDEEKLLENETPVEGGE
jgi:F420-non-reducing hydrogenase iron-sulfur subunit